MAISFSNVLFREDWRAFPLGHLPCDETARGEYMCRVVPDAPNGWYQAGRELNIRPPENRDLSFWRVRRSGKGRAVEQPDVTPGECLILTTGEKPWRDVSVSARVKASGERSAGLIARYVTSRDFYALVLEGGRLKLLRRLEGVYTTLADVPAPLARKKCAWELRCEGDRLTARLNRRVVLEATDGAIAAGGVGVLGNGPIAVETLTVRCPAGEKLRRKRQAARTAKTLKRHRQGLEVTPAAGRFASPTWTATGARKCSLPYRVP